MRRVLLGTVCLAVLLVAQQEARAWGLVCYTTYSNGYTDTGSCTETDAGTPGDYFMFSNGYAGYYVECYTMSTSCPMVLDDDVLESLDIPEPLAVALGTVGMEVTRIPPVAFEVNDPRYYDSVARSHPYAAGAISSDASVNAAPGCAVAKPGAEPSAWVPLLLGLALVAGRGSLRRRRSTK